MYDRMTFMRWECDTPLTSGNTFYPTPGVNEFGANAIDVSPCIYLRFTYRSQLLSSLTLRGYQRIGGVGEVLWTMVIPAAAFTDTYKLPAPLNSLGRYTIQMDCLRFELADLATANHTYTRFVAKAWWGG